MKIRYKCRKNNWFYKYTDEEMEAFYLELEHEELTDELKSLLAGEEQQIKHQLEEFGKIYIIVNKILTYAICVPHSYGPDWPISGHWDMSDNFIFMNNKIINTINELQYL